MCHPQWQSSSSCKVPQSPGPQHLCIACSLLNLVFWLNPALCVSSNFTPWTPRLHQFSLLHAHLGPDIVFQTTCSLIASEDKLITTVIYYTIRSMIKNGPYQVYLLFYPHNLALYLGLSRCSRNIFDWRNEYRAWQL